MAKRSSPPAASAPLRIELLPLSDLKPNPQNPKSHDIGAIHSSLDRFGFRAPVTIDERTGFLWAGHGRWKTLVQKRANGDPAPDNVQVRDDGEWLVPVVRGLASKNDKDAKAYLIADNRIVTLGGWDDAMLASLLEELAAQDPEVNLAGTGYDGDDLDALMKKIGSTPLPGDFGPSPDFAPAPVAQTPLAQLSPQQAQAVAAQQAVAGTARAGVTRPDHTTQDDTVQSLDQMPDTLKGALQLDEDTMYESSLPWNIPALREDMLVEALPQPLDTWVNRHVTADDGLTTWFYNYNAARSAGLPWDRTLMSFFTNDVYFENWWDMPANYVSRILNAGVRMAVVPDFSLWWDDPLALQLFNVYRAQWLGRFMQDAGIRVIPRLPWAHPSTYDFAWLGIPKGCPVACMQLQTMDASDSALVAKGIRKAVEVVQPQTLVVYAGNPGRKFIEGLDLLVDRIVFLPTVWVRLRQHPDYADGKKKPDLPMDQPRRRAMTGGVDPE